MVGDVSCSRRRSGLKLEVPGGVLFWCNRCSRHQPESSFYAGSLARGFYECKRCVCERVKAARKAAKIDKTAPPAPCPASVPAEEPATTGGEAAATAGGDDSPQPPPAPQAGGFAVASPEIANHTPPPPRAVPVLVTKGGGLPCKPAWVVAALVTKGTVQRSAMPWMQGGAFGC